jgi:FlaA1/EpsC-like NDP-sugar epimerase
MLELIGRDKPLFTSDIERTDNLIKSLVNKASFLIIGGGGSIGQAVVKQIFKRDPKILHVVDISENNLVELVRDIRSDLGYCRGDFKTFCLDCGGIEFESLLNKGETYDYIFNLSALKHVRSEKDPYSLMRMIFVNIINTIKIAKLAKSKGTKKYFCVSTDKAANPVNMMGASKRIMEMYLFRESLDLPISMARFANVAFSDGSLLHGFDQRLKKQQPISAPKYIKRYFVSSDEAGELCLLSGLLGENREIFYPKLNDKLHQITFPEIAKHYLKQHGYEPYLCKSEEEARRISSELILIKKWPCFFSKSDTTGEKDFEEFFTDEEDMDLDRFDDIGVIKNEAVFDNDKLESFLQKIHELRDSGIWQKEEIVELFLKLLPSFEHKNTGKYLEQKM